MKYTIILLLTTFVLLPFCSAHTNGDVVRFSKKMYSALGSDTSLNVAKQLLPEYSRLNNTSNGTLGQTLEALIEMRMQDLKLSIKHAKKAREVLDIIRAD
jgi:hypothetical protein